MYMRVSPLLDKSRPLNECIHNYSKRIPPLPYQLLTIIIYLKKEKKKKPLTIIKSGRFKVENDCIVQDYDGTHFFVREKEYSSRLYNNSMFKNSIYCFYINL